MKASEGFLSPFFFDIRASCGNMAVLSAVLVPSCEMPQSMGKPCLAFKGCGAK